MTARRRLVRAAVLFTAVMVALETAFPNRPKWLTLVAVWVLILGTAWLVSGALGSSDPS